MGKGERDWRQQLYRPQQALTLSSRLLVLLREELGMSIGPKVTRLLVNEIVAVVEETLLPMDHMQPGQVLVLAPEIGQGPSFRYSRLEEKKLKPIRLTLIDADDIKLLIAGKKPHEIRLRRLLRFIREAHEQGAALSSSQLSLITGLSPDTINRQLRRHMETTGEVLPVRGIIEDMSSAISHKKQIIARHLKGESTSEISRATKHTPLSVERYVQRFEQVRELVKRIGEQPLIISRILKCSPMLVVEYLKLLPEA